MSYDLLTLQKNAVKDPSGVCFIAPVSMGRVLIKWSDSAFALLYYERANLYLNAVVLAVLPGTRATEVKVCEQFAAARIGGDYYTLTPALAKFIRDVQLKGATALEDPWKAPVLRFMESLDNWPASLGAIAYKALHVTLAPSMQSRLTKILRSAGYSSKAYRVNGTVVRKWACSE